MQGSLGGAAGGSDFLHGRLFDAGLFFVDDFGLLLVDGLVVGGVVVVVLVMMTRVEINLN